MYCNRCGKPIDTQPYCPHCGAPTGLTAPVAGAPARGLPVAPGFLGSRVSRHLRTLGILWVVFAVYVVLQWLLMMPFLHAAFGDRTLWMQGSEAWFTLTPHGGGWLLHAIAIVIFVRAILSLAVGIVLLTRQSGGRVFAIVIAFLTLLKPVLGTVLAIYTLWVLLSRNAGPEYERIALSDGVRPF